jgi:hypothetical protein
MAGARRRAIVAGMLDAGVVEACTHCLVGAAVCKGADGDLALTATALARDLADSHGNQAAALLGAATQRATAYLDASDLEAGAFAVSLRRLSTIRARVDAMLADACGRRGPLPA